MCVANVGKHARSAQENLVPQTKNTEQNIENAHPLEKCIPALHQSIKDILKKIINKILRGCLWTSVREIFSNKLP